MNNTRTVELERGKKLPFEITFRDSKEEASKTYQSHFFYYYK